jgi:DNA-binding beta-propeller fold protein YncE
LVLLSWGGAKQAFAACAGPCSAESQSTGLAHPPAWATGRRVHFEPGSVVASAYADGETAGGGGGEGENEGGPLLYHEGGSVVQHTPKVYVIFWGSNFENKTEGKEVHTMLLKLYGGLTGSAYQGILTQYFDSTGRISSTVTVTSYQDNTVAAPANLNVLKVEEEVASAISRNKWTAESNAQFVVATAPGSTYESGYPGGCAYHEYTSGGIIYALVPYQGDEQFRNNGCIETGNPSKNPIRKTSKSASHEYAEAATDPQINAWYAASGKEIADICQSNEDLELSDGAWVQNQYDDHQIKCSHEDLSPPHVYVITESASSVGSNGATLNGLTNSEGVKTNDHFEYGKGKSYGSKTSEVSAGSGVENVKASQTITGLAANTTYHYRVVAANSTGTANGEDHEFTTPKAPPTATTGSATGVTTTEAVLQGTVNPHGFATTDQFEYGLTTSYGTTVPVPSESAGSGVTEVAKGYLLTGLQPNTTYHFRLVGTSSEGTADGKDVSFTTATLTPTYSSAFGSEGTGNGQFKEPTGIAVDPIDGTVTVSDEKNNRIEEFNQAGEYVRQFGTEGTGNGQFKEPRGVASDSKGNVWVTDTGNDRVEELAASGKYLGQLGSEGSGNGQLSQPKGLAIQTKGNVWVADSANNRIEEFNEKGEYLRQFSTGTNPIGVAVDSKGDIWNDNENETGEIEEHNEKGELLQKFATRGEGNGQLWEPKRLTVDSNGYVWVADGGNARIEVFNEKGEYVTKFGTYGTGVEQMRYPTGVVIDASGDVWVADDENSRVDKWEISSPWPPTFSSAFGSEGTGNGQFKGPTDISVDPVNGIMTVSDEKNNRIEEFGEKGEYLRQFGTQGKANGQLKAPAGLASDSVGNVWVTDSGNNRIEKFTETGEYLSQFGSKGSGNGQLSQPKDLAIQVKGNVWVADSGNKRIEEFNQAGEYVRQFSTGTNPIGVGVDSKGDIWNDNENETGEIEEHNEKGELLQKFATRGEGNGQLLEPKRLAVDANGYVWVADGGNSRVEVFNGKGEYVTKFGTSGKGSEQMQSPTGVIIDPSGHVWVADDQNDRVDEWIR